MLSIKWNQITQCYDVKVRVFGNRELFDRYITCIKSIPALHRKYDPDTKDWSIAEQFLPVLENLLNGLKLQYDVFPKPQAVPPFMQGSVLSETDKYILTFFKSLSYEVASKAFKLGMAEAHPDRNPSSDAADKCAYLSEAWQYLKTNFYKKD